MLLLFEVVRDYVEVLRLTWVYVGVTFLNYGTSLALYPAVAALVRPVSQESTPWNDIYFLPVWYAPFSIPVLEFLEQSMGSTNRVGIGLSYRPVRARIFKLLRSPRIDSKESL
jgi:hypothetical protein